MPGRSLRIRAASTQLQRSETAAIVTTLRNPGPALSSFLAFHRTTGFDQFFLFFDDPDDPAIEVARAVAGVTVIPNDDHLQRLWRTSDPYRLSHLRDFSQTEVMARQLLNVGVAISMARERGIGWILHIDADELFYSEQPVADHFASLSRKGIRRATYLNHEAVPEHAHIKDPFKEVTLFKNNRVAWAPEFRDKRAELSSRFSQFPPGFFHFYSNGKSAARVRPGLTAPGVHGFRHPEEFRPPVTTFRSFTQTRPVAATAKAVPIIGEMLKTSGLRLAKARVGTNPAILHYACCGFDAFWDKYELLGPFGDKWFGRDDIAEKIGSFHLESRDVVATGDRERALEFYAQRMVLSDQSEIASLIEAQVLRRITGPSILVDEISRHTAGPPPPAPRSTAR